MVYKGEGSHVRRNLDCMFMLQLMPARSVACHRCTFMLKVCHDEILSNTEATRRCVQGTAVTESDIAQRPQGNETLQETTSAPEVIY